MKKFIAVFLSITLLIGSLALTAGAATETDYTIISTYDCVDWDNWGYYKANLHTHTVASDADDTITDMINEYYNQDYDILSITDHGVINHSWTQQVKTNGVFNYFRKAEPLSMEDYERITTGADRNGRGMTEIPGGIEINMAVVSKTHVNAFFTQYGQGEWGVENDYRTAAAKVDELGGISFLNHIGDWTNAHAHPERSHWNSYISYIANIFKDYHSCVGMEIVNDTDYTTSEDRALWDELLQVVIPTGRNIFAFSNDDSHSVSDVGSSFEYFLLPENTTENVKEAMMKGNFFSCSRFCQYSDDTPTFEGNGDVPLVKNIIIDQAENSIELVLDEARDCKEIKWIANGEVISGESKIDLNDFEDKLGCYIRFELWGDGGVTYSQAMELQYDGRVDKEIPELEDAFSTKDGKDFLLFYRTLPFAVIEFLIEELYGMISDLF